MDVEVVVAVVVEVVVAVLVVGETEVAIDFTWEYPGQQVGYRRP